MAQTSLRSEAISPASTDNQHSASLQRKSGQPRPDVPVPGLGNVVSGFVEVGSSNSYEKTFTITNLGLSTDTPSTVLLQPRQFTNQDFGFPDEFVVMVITTARDHMVVRIRRADVAGGGWGQDLRLDVLIVE